jgi:hypothetical protein
MRNQDSKFESSSAEALDREKANRKVMDSVARFARPTDLSFRRAACDMIFKFVLKLIAAGISILCTISPRTRIVNVFDRFSAQKRMMQLTSQQFDTSIVQLEDICFLNVSVVSRTIHAPTLVHCVDAATKFYSDTRSETIDL